MKKIFLLTSLLAFAATSCINLNAQGKTDVGMWYSTWYADVPSINTTWITNFGADASNWFIGDVNGDGKDDAVIFKSDGSWWVALSNGNGFSTPTQWITGHGVGSSKQFLADVNGDGKKDAVVYFASTGDWYVALSNGSGFNNYSLWISGHGVGSSNQLMGDVDGDGKEDAVVYFGSTGNWYVALSNGSGFNSYSQWASNLGAGTDKQFLGDLNGDKKEDAVCWISSTGVWTGANSSGTSFGVMDTLTSGHGVGSQNQFVTDGNGDGFADLYVYFNADVNGDGLSGDWYGRTYNRESGLIDSYDWVENSGFGYNASQTFQGNVTGDPYGYKASIAFYLSTGTWQVQPYHYFKTNLYNTWSAWNIKYIPLTHGSFQQYDSGDTTVIDEHLSNFINANINFLILDETNHLYTDDNYIFYRAEAVASRISNWNSNNSKKIKYSIAIGGIQFSHDPADIEWEAGQVLSQFTNTANGDTTNYYYLNGKPLLVVYCSLSDESAWDTYAGDKTYANQFTIRFAHSPAQSGNYGWELDSTGTVSNSEVMVVMPGWNNNKGATPVSRSYGDYYALSCWDKVLTNSPKPQIVAINSFNDYAEETAVAVTYTNNVTSPSEIWYDKSLQIDSSMYWNLTKNYISLLETGNYQASLDYSKGQNWYRWSYQHWNGTSFSNMYWDGNLNCWKGNQTYCLISNNWQHPDTNDSARKWVAPDTGHVGIVGNVRLNTLGGDGIVARIVQNGTIIWGPYTITDTVGLNYNLAIYVNAQDSIYFIVNRNANNSYDQTDWNPTITYQYLTPKALTRIKDIQVPQRFFLSQNYPNPFNPSTEIKYSIPQSSVVVLKIYNMLGQEVATLVNQEQKSGNYIVDFNASNLASGVYMFRIQAEGFTLTKKMILLK